MSKEKMVSLFEDFLDTVQACADVKNSGLYIVRNAYSNKVLHVLCETSYDYEKHTSTYRKIFSWDRGDVYVYSILVSEEALNYLEKYPEEYVFEPLYFKP